MSAIRLQWEPVRSLAAASISGTYMGIGTMLTNPCRILWVQNLTDETLMFSVDGINDAFPLASNGFVLLDVTANQTLIQGAYFAAGMRIYVKSIGANPTMNAVYVSTIYGAIN